MLGELIVYEIFKVIGLCYYYRGGCGSRNKEIKEDARELESYIYRKECELKLQNLSYQVYLGAIMRFGYKSDLND